MTLTDNFHQILQSIPNAETRISIEFLFTLLLLNSQGIKVNHLDYPANGVDTIQFNTSFADGSSEGRLQWNLTDGTLEVGMPGGHVNLQIGQEHLIRVKNESGAEISNGKMVYISGSTGDRAKVQLADADNLTTMAAIGMTTESIANNQFGYITTFGLVRDINTAHVPSGSPAWLSSTAGEFQSTRPTPPVFNVVCGICIRSHATEGVMLCKIDIVPRLQGLSDVYGTPSNGDTIRWNSTNNRFEFGV